MSITVPVYNERVKLAASAFNLIAVGMVAIGVTTPLVSATYGTHVIIGQALVATLPVLLVWVVSACVMHLLAQLVLGSLIS